MRLASVIPVLLTVTCLGCTSEPSPRMRTYYVNEGVVRLALPDGWEHVSYGREHQFRRGDGRLTLELIKAYPYPPQVDRILKQLGHNSQRSVASQRTIVVNDTEIVIVETWDHLSHAWPMRIALAPCANKQLVLHTRHGSYEASREAFDLAVASLEIIRSDSRP